MAIRNIHNIIGYIPIVGLKRNGIFINVKKENAKIFNSYFYDRCDGDLREGYAC